jgi:S1-C subfamily serine protease
MVAMSRLVVVLILVTSWSRAWAQAAPAPTRIQVSDETVSTVLLDLAAGDVTVKADKGGALRVDKVSPALASAGVHAGDVIVKVDGAAPGKGLAARVRAARAKDACLVSVVRRGGAELALEHCFGQPQAAGELVCPRAVVTRLASGTVRVSRAEVDRLLADPGMHRCSRVVPAMADNKPTGMKVYAIKPGSWLAELGLQNGDTVRALNGLALAPMDQALATFQTIKSASRIQIDLERRGTPMTLIVEVTP